MMAMLGTYASSITAKNNGFFGRSFFMQESGFRLESRFRKSEQDDKWNFCLTTAIVAVNRRNHEQTTPPQPLTGLQGKGGSRRRQGRPHNRPVGGAFRCSPQSDHGLAIAALWQRFRAFWMRG